MDARTRTQVMSNEFRTLEKIYGKKIINNEKLSKHSWFNLGGPAEIFFRPDNTSDLSSFLKQLKNMMGNATQNRLGG